MPICQRVKACQCGPEIRAMVPVRDMTQFMSDYVPSQKFIKKKQFCVQTDGSASGTAPPTTLLVAYLNPTNRYTVQGALFPA
jgi:hypothetical protein